MSKEEYFEPGSVHGENVKKLKKEEDDQNYEYFEVKVSLICVCIKKLVSL